MYDLPNFGFKLDITDFLTVGKHFIDKSTPDKENAYKDEIESINHTFEIAVKNFIRGIQSSFSYGECRKNINNIIAETEKIIDTLKIPYMENFIVFNRSPLAVVDGGENVYRLYSKALELMTDLEKKIPASVGRPNNTNVSIGQYKEYFISDLASLYEYATNNEPTRTGGGSSEKSNFVKFCENVIAFLNKQFPNIENGHYIILSVDDYIQRILKKKKVVGNNPSKKTY